MSFWENNKGLLQWAIPIVLGLLGTGGIGSYVVKGVTVEAVEKAKTTMQVKVDTKNAYIKKLEDEIDILQLDAVTIGFRYDMCCAGNPCK